MSGNVINLHKKTSVSNVTVRLVKGQKYIMLLSLLKELWIFFFLLMHVMSIVTNISIGFCA